MYETLCSLINIAILAKRHNLSRYINLLCFTVFSKYRLARKFVTVVHISTVKMSNLLVLIDFTAVNLQSVYKLQNDSVENCKFCKKKSFNNVIRRK